MAGMLGVPSLFMLWSTARGYAQYGMRSNEASTCCSARAAPAGGGTKAPMYRKQGAARRAYSGMVALGDSSVCASSMALDLHFAKGLC